MQYIMIIFALVFSTVHLFSTVGGLDTSFSGDGIVVTDVGSSSIDVANACAVQPDGKIVVVGSSGNNIALVRYTVAGGLDSEFGGTGKVTQGIGTVAIAYGVAIQNDGKIVVTGTSDTHFFVARFLANGSLDTAGFNASTGYIIQSSLALLSVDAAYAVTLNPVNQKIIVTGSSGINMFVAQYTTSGALDTGAFGGGNGFVTQAIGSTSTIAYAVALDASYNIVVAGLAVPVATQNLFVARFSGSGVLDTATFNNPTGYNTQSLTTTASVVYGLGFQNDGNIIAAGTDGVHATLARFTTTGGLDTSFGVSSSGYNAANTFGGTSAIGYGVIIQPDNKIVIGGSVVNISTGTDFVIARFLSDGSSLDSSFAPSNGYTVTDISGVADIGRSLAMQPNNRFIQAGTVGSSPTDFAAARYMGDPAPAGASNASYNSSGATPGYITYPTDSTSSDKPVVKALQILSDNSVFVLTEDLATTPQSQLVQLDSAGAVNIDPIDIAQTGGADVIVDSHGRALVVGGNGSNGWIARYVPTSGTPGSFALDSGFNGGAIKVQSSSPTTTAYARVCEQPSGNILAMGQNGTTGIIVAYNQDGTVNTNFGTSGVYSFSTTTLSDMVVDSSGCIYVVGSVTSSNIKLYRILANGSGLDISYNSTGIIDTGFASVSYQGAKLAGMSSSTQATIVTVNFSTYQFEFKQYSSSGSVDATLSIPQATTLLNSPVITQLQIDSDGQLVFVGYDDNYFFLGRLLNDLSDLDPAFAPNGSPQGLLKTKYDDVNPSRVANCLGISPNGAIVFGGYENIDSSNTVSVIGNVVGSDSVYELVRYPGAEIGQVDTTFGTNGIQLVAAAGISDAGMQLYVLPNGKILVTSVASGNTVLEQLTSAYALDTASFNSGATGGSIAGTRTLTGLSNPQNLMVDAAGNIYVTGDNGSGQMMLFKVSSSGTLLWINSSSNLQVGNVALQQASGRIVVAGQTSSSGAIVGFNPNTGALDLDFGNDGYYTTGINKQIIGAAISATDKIMFTYRNSSNAAALQQIYSNGSGLDSGFGTGTQTLISSVAQDYQIRLQKDVNNKIVLVAMDTSNHYVARRYTSSGNDDVGPVTVVPTSIIATPYLQDVMAVSDGSTLVLGIDNSGATIEMFKLTSAFAKDTNFNYSTGFLETTIPGSPYSMTMFDAFDVVSSQGILVVGNAGAGGGALNRVYNDDVVTKVNQNGALAGAGTLDTTYNATGTNPGFLNMSTELTTDLTSARSVKAVLQLADGSYYVAADNGASNTYITYFSSDDIQQTSFGSSGVLTISGKGNVSNMLLTQSGKLLVVGGDGTGWIKQYNATTGALDTSFAATTVLDKMLTVQQQSDGRIIVAGGLVGVGTLIAYNSVTGAIDTTFGVNGYYTATGFYPINGLVVDADDYVYWMANSNDMSLLATTKKLSPTAASVIWTGDSTIANDNDIESNHLALDQNGNIVAVGIDIGPLNIVVKRYLATNGTTLATGTISASSMGFGDVTPHTLSMQIDTTPSLGNIIITGYAETDPVSPFVIRVLADLSGLDTSFNGSGVQAIGVPSSTEGVWYDAIINQEGKILVGGYAKISSNKPYLMQLYGDSFVGQYLPTISAGTQGTIDTNFGTSGYVALGGLGAGTPLAGATPLEVLPLSSGYYYMVFDNGKLARFTNANILDTTFNAAATTNIQGLAADDVPAGTSSMIIDGAGRLVVAGTDGSGHGWIQRYVAGDTGLVDTVANGGIGFNTTGSIDLGMSTIATTVIEQTLGRYVVASQLASGNGALFAFTNLGITDTTFNNPGATPGIFDTGIPAGVYGLISDVYDRLIFAIADTGASAVYVGRLTSAGQNDTTFGNAYSGSLNTLNGGAGILQNADIEEQVRLAFDSSGNIVIAAHQHTSTDTIAVVAYDNNTGSATPVYGQYDISDLTSPTLTDLITTTDGKVLLSGNQTSMGSGTDVDMWVARVKANAGNYELDNSFNPGGADIIQGIMNFNFYSGSNPRVLSSIAIYGDGQIIMAGSEDDGSMEPFVGMAYDNPYTVQIAFCQDSQPVGTNDTTLGASSTTATNLGITFFASSGATAASGQVARAVDLQDDANIVVAVDGGASSGSATPSQIFLKMFTIDGTPQTTFGASGQRTVLTSYAQQFVNDMVTFTTVAGVHKAILAGYVSCSSPALTGSLVLQYDLDTHTIDSSFGGLNSNVPGTAVGDAQQINCVGLQSTGRIIASGLDLNNQGVILGYTTAGKLDSSFGNGGGYFTSTEMAPIYTHAIDSQNRIIIAYEDQYTQANIVRCLADGSSYDSSFNSVGLVNTLITTYGNNGMKVAVDSSDNVIIAVGSDDYTYFTVQSYSGLNGTLNNQFSSDGLISLTHFVLTKLLIDIDGRAIVIGYDTDSDEIVIVRLTSSLDLDTSNFDAPNGYLAYAVAGGSSQVVTDALIHPDGRILIVGSEL